jgi:hypothetical protein
MSSSGFYRLKNSLAQRVKSIFKDRSRKMTPEEKMRLHPSQDIEQMMTDDAAAKEGVMTKSMRKRLYGK